MELMDVIATRRSVRAYTEQPVARETLQALLATAVQAPTAMNSQPWAFAVIQDRARMRMYSDRAKALLLAAMAADSPMTRYREMLSDPTFNIFYEAPALVLILAKPGSVAPVNDCSMAAYALMLAAREQGLGTCWIGFAIGLFNDPTVKAELGIPTDYTIVAPLIVGYPQSEFTTMERNAPDVVCWQE